MTLGGERVATIDYALARPNSCLRRPAARNPCADQSLRLRGLFGTVGRNCGEAAEAVVKRWWPAQRLYQRRRSQRAIQALFRSRPEMTPVM